MQWLRRLFSRRTNEVVSYDGNYLSFEEAEKKCIGYDSQEIFQKVVDSTMKVVSGEAQYERDSYVFYERSINYNLMYYLMKLYLEEKKLRISDWGGALGSVYFQHKEMLDSLNVKWTVIEQEHFADFGKKNLENKNLQFISSSGLENELPESDCVLFSGVLQYLRNPEVIIEQVCLKMPKYIILERTSIGTQERIWIETVHEPIYEATYACRVFEEKKLIEQFTSKGYGLIDKWHSLVDGDIDKSDIHVEFMSYVFEYGN